VRAAWRAINIFIKKGEFIMPEDSNDELTTGQDNTSTQSNESKHGKIIDIITKIGNYLKIPLMKLLNCTAFFIIVYLIAWITNAIYNNIHFDLESLRNFYIMVIGREATVHGINSIYNSDKGQMPEQKSTLPTNRGK